MDNPSPVSPLEQGDHVGVHPQKDGRFYVGLAPTVGRVSGTVLTGLADLLERYGAAGARLTAQQKVVVLGLDADRVDGFVRDAEAVGLSARPSNWRRSTMACTGIEFCKLAIVDTKNRATALVAELERRFPDLDTPITVNVNGCPNACARTQVADIGLKGQLVVDADGRQVEGFQVHLGGALGLESAFGRKLRAHKVTSAGLDDYVTNLVTAYLAQRLAGERFADVGGPRRRRLPARRTGGGGGGRMSSRGIPFHCPYCGDENLRPHVPDEGEGHGAWECHACLRAFTVRMLGMIARPESASGARS